jgi:TonB-dependent SusC/RagA subfamily outer membrane receptor
MKKKSNNGSALRKSLKKDLKMKLTILLLVVSLFQVQANTKFEISLDFDNASIERIFSKIEEVSDFRFLYETGSIDLERKLSLKVNTEKIADVLVLLFKGIAVHYKIRGRQIVLTQQDLGASLPRIYSPDTTPNRKTTLQQQEITGTVTDGNGTPLPGANILEKGSKNGVTTDFDGNFSLEVGDENVTLVISYVGFETKEVPLNGQANVVITLTESAAALDEVVGYGTVKKSDLTGSVSSVTTEATEDIPNTNILQSLSGRVAGLSSTVPNRPGEEPSVNIRGINSLSASNTPLIVVDGIIYNGSINDFSVNDIEKIDILKDASAAAVYGSRSSNGVILITTKMGKTNKPMFNFNTYYGISNPVSLIPILDVPGYIQKVLDYRQSVGLEANPNNVEDYLLPTEASNTIEPLNLL